MLASSTHDTKRSEDVRARINVLSEIPAEWYRAIRAWQRLNEEKKIQVAGESRSQRERRVFPVSDSAGRVAADRHGQRRARGLRRQDSHLHGESPARGESQHQLDQSQILNTKLRFTIFWMPFWIDSAGKPFLDQFAPFQARIAKAGIFNSLSQTLLKIAAPGLPDFYQGTEVWNFSLADPDNRRPVDYDRLQTLLAQLHAAESEDPAALVDRLLASPADGSLKLYVTRCALRFRREHRALFAKGSYVPLRAAGEKNKHVIAFARSFRGTTVLVLAGRFFAQLGASTRQCRWVQRPGETRRSSCASSFLPATYRDVFTGKDSFFGVSGMATSSSRSPERLRTCPLPCW